MDIAQLALVERTKLVQEIQGLQDIFDSRQRLQDFLTINIADKQAQLAALDSQVAKFPVEIATEVGVLVADQAATAAEVTRV